MKITIELDSDSEMDKLSALLKEFKVEKVSVVPDNHTMITKGDDTIDPRALFGIWADNPRTIEDIRQKAWKRKS